MKRLIRGVSIVISLLLLTSCQLKEEKYQQYISTKGQFLYTVGWLTPEQILFVEKDLQYEVKSFNIFTGEVTVYYQTRKPIVQVKIHPSLKELVVQEGELGEAEFVFVDSISNHVIKKVAFSAYEIDFQWSPFDRKKWSVTVFEEDWSYTNYLQLDELYEVTLAPFLQWGADHVVYLDEEHQIYTYMWETEVIEALPYPIATQFVLLSDQHILIQVVDRLQLYESQQLKKEWIHVQVPEGLLSESVVQDDPWRLAWYEDGQGVQLEANDENKQRSEEWLQDCLANNCLVGEYGDWVVTEVGKKVAWLQLKEKEKTPS